MNPSSCQRVGSVRGEYTNPQLSMTPQDVVMSRTCPFTTSLRLTTNSPTRPRALAFESGDARMRCASRVSSRSLARNRARNSGFLGPAVAVTATATIARPIAQRGAPVATCARRELSGRATVRGR